MSGVLGAGWRFPVRPGQDGGLALVGGDERIRQSIWLVLATAPGERVMLPDFGCGVHDLVFQPNTAAVRGSVRAEVRDALVRWEPRIDVIDVAVTQPPDRPEVMLIEVEYRIRSTNAFYNLVYPLFITEGIAAGRGRGGVLDDA
ncbi:GPW/gp25 family protein [Geodermatophilus sp. SYSU D00742]